MPPPPKPAPMVGPPCSRRDFVTVRHRHRVGDRRPGDASLRACLIAVLAQGGRRSTDLHDAIPPLVRAPAHYGISSNDSTAAGTSAHPDPAGERAVDREAGWVAPALFDLQINGCDGAASIRRNLTVDDIRHVVERMPPSRHRRPLSDAGHAAPPRRCCTASPSCGARARRTPSVARAVPRLHLEGPYISPEDGPRGAHPQRHVRPPDWDEFRRFQDAAGGRIRLVTLAPEHDGALTFIEKLTASGVVVALGHTAASGQRIRDAVAGRRPSVHAPRQRLVTPCCRGTTTPSGSS